MKNRETSSFSLVLLLVLSIIIGYTHHAADYEAMESIRTASNGDPGAQDEFDPNVLPAPAAGLPGGSRAKAYNCKDMVYQTTTDGINYVREFGGIYNAAIVNNRFGVYRLSYGHLQKVNARAVERETIAKLRYGLKNCDETYIRSGAQVLSSVALSGSEI